MAATFSMVFQLRVVASLRHPPSLSYGATRGYGLASRQALNSKPGLRIVKNLRHLLNCIPIAGRRCYPEFFLDLAEVADRLHLPTIQTQNESVLDRNDLQQPVIVRGQTERKRRRRAKWFVQDVHEARYVRARWLS